MFCFRGEYMTEQSREAAKPDEKLEVVEEKKETIPLDYKEEVIETESCKLMMDSEGNIHVECSKPTEKLKISKKELDMLSGLSTLVPNAGQ